MKLASLPFFVIVLLFLVSGKHAFAQDQVTISGTIKEGDKNEELIAAKVRVIGLNLGVLSNEYGFYSLSLPKGSYQIVFSSSGYLSDTLQVDLNESLRKNVILYNEVSQIEEFVVLSKRQDENVRSAQMGVERLNPKDLDKFPVLFGEKDFIKIMQLTPGVKSAGEGSSGFYVRGGGADQNLILLDEAIVYNASHLLGFFSTFNSDAIKDAVLYKGTAPANYGGRLASVLDIKMNEGNNNKYNVSGGIGLISSRLNVEGPIVKDKASFLISGRRTYADMFLKATKNFKDTKLFFYDLNAKVNYRISDKDRIFLSGYFGRDKLGLADIFGLEWGNATGTIRWNRIVSDKLFSNTSLIYSSYDYKIGIASGTVDFDILSKVNDANIKQDFQYFFNSKNTIRFGANVIHHSIVPGQIRSNGSTGLNTQEYQAQNSLESALYINNSYELSSRFSLNYGLRFSGFTFLANEDNYYTYNDEGQVSGTEKYKKNKVLKNYFYIEPRVSASYILTESQSIKAAYSRNTQNIHLVSNSTSASPTDVWVSTSKNTKPGIADLISLGWFKNLDENKYELSVETYYKSMQNQIDFRDGADVSANDKLEGEFLYGIGRAYGIEMMLKKKSGRFTGWISYTLAKSERKIDGINNFEWYNAKQDRTHDISVVGAYEINKKVILTGLFVFYTGNAVTFPSGKYIVNGETQYAYTERNGSRMPAYHRLDLGVTWIRKSTAKFESSWNFSIYNAYGRQNPYIIQFKENEFNPNIVRAEQTSLFRWVPAVTYNFKFK